MRNLHKSLPLLAAGMLLGALGAHAQGSFSNSVSRAVDRSASRSAGRGSVSSASSTALAGGVSLSGGGSGPGGHAGGGMSSLGSASLTPARIASFCGKQASNSRAASACSSAGYTPRATRSSFAVSAFSAPAGAAAAPSASGMDGDGSGFAADDMMGGSDAVTGDDALGGDALAGDSLGGEGDVSISHAARPAPHSRGSHEQPAAAARYAHAGQLAATGSRKRRSHQD